MFALLLASAALAATPSLSAADGETTVTHVAYLDLDLTSAQGKAELDRRIKRAIRSVCSNDYDPGFSRLLLNSHCRYEAAANVRPIREKVLADASAGRRSLAASVPVSTSSPD